MYRKTLFPLMCKIGLSITIGTTITGSLLISQIAFARDDMMKGDDMMMQIDTNHDGMISAQEHADYVKMKFDTMDTNHDGMVSKSEMKAAHDMHMNSKTMDGDRMHDDMMMKMHVNHDGMISAQDHADYMKSKFDAMDTNHDGMLSKGEMEAMHGR